MFNIWAKFLVKHGWFVIGCVSIVIILAGIFGPGVFAKLSSNGFNDPNAASTQESNLLSSQFSKQGVDLIVLFSSPSLNVSNPTFEATVKQDIGIISSLPHVTDVSSYYTNGYAAFISTNHHETYVTIGLSGDISSWQTTYNDLRADLKDGPLTVQIGGMEAINAQINKQIQSDLSHAESLAFPILAILLLIIFRGVVAAAIPLALGGLSILCGLFLTRIITNFTPISVYAINVITLLGLGLAIDYSLFFVSRFREELNRQKTVAKALDTTVIHAGRTIALSGLTVILSLLSLMLLPQSFFKSMGLGGSAAVASTVLLAITALPAVLGKLGHRVNALTLPGRAIKHRDPTEGFWYTVSNFVMRHPTIVIVVVLAVLLTLGSPIRHLQLTNTDISSVPTNLSSRQVSDQLSQNFAGAGTEAISIVIHTTGSPASMQNLSSLVIFDNQVGKLPGVSSINSLDTQLSYYQPGTTVLSNELQARDQALLAQYVSGNYEQVTIYTTPTPQSAQSQTLIKAIRGLPEQPGFTTYVGGIGAQLVDMLHDLKTYLPYVVLLIFVASFILMFLLVGSVVLPIKAIILNVLSLSAAFGILTWIFQYHHLASWFSLATLGSLDSTVPVLVFAIAFGLAMDYEFFLLSRVKEEYDKSNDNTHSVAIGVQRTATIITSAAILLISVIILFATSRISLLEQIGVGLACAVAIDATIVRLLLVPAVMRLLGKWNWWAPAPLRRFYHWLELSE